MYEIVCSEKLLSYVSMPNFVKYKTSTYSVKRNEETCWEKSKNVVKMF